MKIKELINILEELSQQSEQGLDTPVLLVENWASMDTIQQEVRDIELSDLTVGKVNDFPIMRNSSESIEGLIIGYLNTVE